MLDESATQQNSTAPVMAGVQSGVPWRVTGVVIWPGELDVAPDAMYAELKQHGEWKLR